MWLSVYLARCVKSGPVYDSEQCPTGLIAPRKDGDQIPSRCIPSGLARVRNQLASVLSCGVVHLLSRMESCVFTYCSVLHLIFMWKNEKISFVLQGILVHHCQISWICLPWIRMLIGSPYRRAWLWYITGHPVCVSVIQSVLVRDMGVILSASVSINS